MRLAGSQELYNALSDQPDGGESLDKAELFVQTYELLRSKGLGDDAANYYAGEMVNGREPMAKLTRRFAGTYGGVQNTGDSGSAD